MMFSMAMWMAALVAPIQILAGDQHGLNTLEYQPAKIAAMEGHFESHADGAPLILFGWPDMAAERTRLRDRDPEARQPDPDARLERRRCKGLEAVAARGPAASRRSCSGRFRIMVGLGLLMVALGALEPVARAGAARSTTGALLHLLALLMGPSGFIAVLAGWITTEVGRQPYTVYGLLRTADSVSPIAAPAVGASLLAFVVVYFVVFGAGIFYILRLMARAAAARRARTSSRGVPARAAGITPAAGAARAAGAADDAHAIDLAFIWAGLIAFAVLAYVRDGRLRSRHRHPVSAVPATRTTAT